MSCINLPSIICCNGESGVCHLIWARIPKMVQSTSHGSCPIKYVLAPNENKCMDVIVQCQKNIVM